MPTAFRLPSGVPVLGFVVIDGTRYPVLEQAVNYSVVAATTIIAAVPLSRICVIAYTLIPTLNCELEWRSNTTVIRAAMAMGPRIEYGREYLVFPWMKTAVGEALTFRQAQSSGTPAVIRGVLHYALEVP